MARFIKLFAKIKQYAVNLLSVIQVCLQFWLIVSRKIDVFWSHVVDLLQCCYFRSVSWHFYVIYVLKNLHERDVKHIGL